MQLESSREKFSSERHSSWWFQMSSSRPILARRAPWLYAPVRFCWNEYHLGPPCSGERADRAQDATPFNRL